MAGHLSAKSLSVSQTDHSTLTLERFAPEARAWIVAAQALSDERQHAEVVPLHVLSAGLTTEPKLADALSDHVRALCDEAIRAAAADGRKTVLDRDVPRRR